MKFKNHNGTLGLSLEEFCRMGNLNFVINNRKMFIINDNELEDLVDAYTQIVDKSDSNEC